MRSILVLVLTLGAAGVTLAAPVAARAATSSGSILYVKNHDIYAVTPDGRTTRRITHDGGSKTRNHTGGVGYLAPSASADGRIVVAVRNQHVSPVNTQGYLHVLSRTGKPIRTFKPQQFNPVKLNSAPCASEQIPMGILNAYVAPDGGHVVYTAQTEVQSPDCSAAYGYSTFVVGISGKNAHEVTRSNGNGASLEAGMWVNRTRFLLDDIDFGSQGFWYVDLPGHTARAWTQATDYTDGTWELPAQHGNKLASQGYSNVTNARALRLWASSGPPGRPTPQCDVASPVRGDIPNRPTWSPNAAAVAFDVDDSHSAVRAGEGLYVLTVGATVSGASCTAPKQIVHGGFQPFWTPAKLT